MSGNRQHVDGVLVTWGDILFPGRVKSKPGNASLGLKSTSKASGSRGGTGSGASSGSRGSAGGAAGAGGSNASGVRRKLNALVSAKPEVMVKVTGGGYSISQIKRHMDYISRQGELPLEDQDGDAFHGKEAVRDLRDGWRDGGYVIPEEEGQYREALNIVLSMPPGTDRPGVKRAARDFATEIFGDRHDYASVEHDDEDHPHVHLVVRARDHEGRRLNPRKADLRRWREVFAEKLNDHGIEAVATHRHNRAPVRRKDHRQPSQDVREHPWKSAGKQLTKQQWEALKHIAVGLARSEDVADRKLALALAAYAKRLPAISRSEREATQDRPVQQVKRVRERDMSRGPDLER